jgi:hypothetical protein
MRLFATAALLGLVLASPASAQISSRTHNTGTAALRVFNNGYFGADAGVPVDTTFNFGGGSPLYEGQLIVAVSPTQISGQPYSSSIQGPTPGLFDWTFGPRPAVVTPPAGFTRALQTSYTDAGGSNADPAGLTVSQRTLSRTNDDFVVVEINLSSATARTGVHIGMFGDYDISPTAVADRGGFDTATRTAYAFNANATGGNRNYYGVTLLGRAQSGWSTSTDTTTPEGIYRGLTTNGTTTGDPGTTNADRRLIVGAGPFTLAAGVPQQVRFAYVGGTNLADLLANAAAAQGLFATGTSEGPVAAGVALLPASPNPASASATLAFTLDAAQSVRLAVYDVLGREVAVVADGAYGVGTFRQTLDTADLPAGVYVARLTAGGTSTAQRFTVAR